MSEGEQRKVGLPLMTFSLAEEIEQLKSGTQWTSSGRAAIALVKTSELRIVLIALGPGKVLHEHHAEGPITVLVQEGAIRFEAEGSRQKLKAGGLLTLDRVITHQVEALEESTFLLTIVQSQRPER